MISRKQSISVISPVRPIAMAPLITTERVVKAGDSVSIDYTGWLDGGVIFDTTSETVARRAGIFDPEKVYAPVSFVAGSDDLIKGFDAVIGMRIGESKSLMVTPDCAYGNYDPSLIKPVPIAALEKAGIKPRVNDTLYYDMQQVRIDHIIFNAADLNNSSVYIDFNHPMAGKTLYFMVTVRDIQPA